MPMRLSEPMPVDDGGDVGADRLAHGCDGVDEADLHRQEAVRRVLDRLGRGRVGDEDRRVDARRRARRPVRLPHGRRCRSPPGRGAGSRGRRCPRAGTRGSTRRTRRLRWSTRSTASVEPTGTVDLLTTTAPGCSTGAIWAGGLLDVATGRRCRRRPAVSARTGTRCRRRVPQFRRRARTPGGPQLGRR